MHDYLGDPVVYVIGDDNLPISTTLTDAVYHKLEFDIEIPYFSSYNECMNHILNNQTTN